MNSSGFSLTECLIVLALTTLVLMFSVPLYQHHYWYQRLNQTMQSLQNAVLYARNKAILDKEAILITSANEQDWSSGIRVFKDNPTHHYQSGDPIYFQTDWQQLRIHICWQGFQRQDFLRFTANPQHAALNGHFLVRTPDGQQQRLILNRLGRMKLESSNDGECHGG